MRPHGPAQLSPRPTASRPRRGQRLALLALTRWPSPFSRSASMPLLLATRPEHAAPTRVCPTSCLLETDRLEGSGGRPLPPGVSRLASKPSVVSKAIGAARASSAACTPRPPRDGFNPPPPIGPERSPTTRPHQALPPPQQQYTGVPKAIDPSPPASRSRLHLKDHELRVTSTRYIAEVTAGPQDAPRRISIVGREHSRNIFNPSKSSRLLRDVYFNANARTTSKHTPSPHQSSPSTHTPTPKGSAKATTSGC